MHKNLYKSFLLVATVILVVTGCGVKTQKVQKTEQPKQTAKQETTEITDEKTVDKKEKLTITSDVQELKIEVGETKPLFYTVTGGDADTVLDFQSGDPNKISIDKDGNITGVEEGTTYVIAKSGDAECYWNVTIIPAASIIADQTNLDMCVENQKQLKYTVDGGDENYKPEFSSSDESIATVDSTGNVTTTSKDGNVTITAKYGNVATCEWNIVSHPNYLPDGEYWLEWTGSEYKDGKLYTSENIEIDGHYLIFHFPEKGEMGWNSEQPYYGVTMKFEMTEDCDIQRMEGVDENEQDIITHHTRDDVQNAIGPVLTFVIKDNKIVSGMSMS